MTPDDLRNVSSKPASITWRATYPDDSERLRVTYDREVGTLEIVQNDSTTESTILEHGQLEWVFHRLAWAIANPPNEAHDG